MGKAHTYKVLFADANIFYDDLLFEKPRIFRSSCGNVTIVYPEKFNPKDFLMHLEKKAKKLARHTSKSYLTALPSYLAGELNKYSKYGEKTTLSGYLKKGDCKIKVHTFKGKEFAIQFDDFPSKGETRIITDKKTCLETTRADYYFEKKIPHEFEWKFYDKKPEQIGSENEKTEQTEIKLIKDFHPKMFLEKLEKKAYETLRVAGHININNESTTKNMLSSILGTRIFRVIEDESKGLIYAAYSGMMRDNVRERYPLPTWLADRLRILKWEVAPFEKANHEKIHKHFRKLLPCIFKDYDLRNVGHEIKIPVEKIQTIFEYLKRPDCDIKILRFEGKDIGIQFNNHPYEGSCKFIVDKETYQKYKLAEEGR